MEVAMEAERRDCKLFRRYNHEDVQFGVWESLSKLVDGHAICWDGKIGGGTALIWIDCCLDVSYSYHCGFPFASVLCWISYLTFLCPLVCWSKYSNSSPWKGKEEVCFLSSWKSENFFNSTFKLDWYFGQVQKSRLQIIFPSNLGGLDLQLWRPLTHILL